MVPKLAVGVVALTEANEVYLVGQYRYPTERYSWELIEGGGEDGEDTLSTAKRELKEEAGIEASKWELLASEVQLSNCYTSELAYLYLAQDLTTGESSPEATEELIVKKIELKIALQMAISGEISDALSIIGIFLANEKILNLGK